MRQNGCFGQNGLQPRVLARRLLLGSLLCSLALGGCAQQPDPEETRESFTAVTEQPTGPVAAEEYDIIAHPQPIVEPLECANYLVVTARGTAEPKKKNQLLSPVARAISKARPGQVELLDLDYPADTDVNEGGTYGVRILLDSLNVQSKSCPEQQFILLGYSQGALIIGDALAVPTDRVIGSTVGELSEHAAESILAVVLYGNPRFSGTESFAYGDYDDKLGGILPRHAGGLSAFEDRIRDFCVADDIICQSSLSLDESGHVAYYENGMQQDGAAFVIMRMPPSTGLSDATDTDTDTDASTEAETDATPAQ